MTKQNARKLNQSERNAYGRCESYNNQEFARNGALHKAFSFCMLFKSAYP